MTQRSDMTSRAVINRLFRWAKGKLHRKVKTVAEQPREVAAIGARSAG